MMFGETSLIRTRETEEISVENGGHTWSVTRQAPGDPSWTAPTPKKRSHVLTDSIGQKVGEDPLPD